MRRSAAALHSWWRVRASAPEVPVDRPASVLPEFSQLYEDNAAFVWRTLRRLGVRPADLEDACQEVFVVVHRKRDTFNATAAVRTWLFGIARRVAADHRRRAHVRRETIGLPHALDLRESAQTFAPSFELARARAMLDEILDELDDAKRAVFILFELEEMAMTEVARAVECPLQTAYSRLAAARKQVEAAVRRRQLQGERP